MDAPAGRRWLATCLRPITGAWLRGRRPQPHAVVPGDVLEPLVRERTAELERTIATLRQELERLTAAEREQARARTAAEAADAAKSAFLASMSHEIRTPMNGVIGVAHLLRGTPLHPDQAELVQTLCQSGDWLLAIINDILDFSKIEAGRLLLEKIDFDLAGEIQLAVDLHAEAAARKGLELAVDIDAAVPAFVCGDPGRLRQIVANLVSNAVKFTCRGGVKLSVGLEAECAAGPRLRFSVIDSGVGIPAEVQPLLFQPFMQAEAATARRFGGTGLGLAIAKRLVGLMGGEIGVVSAAGAGATFWFNVELEHAREPFVENEAVSLTGRQVLIVDDNPANGRLFVQLATAWGMFAGRADSLPRALAHLREAARAQQPVEIVILDRDLAGADGLAFAQAIQAETRIPRPRIMMLASDRQRLGRAEMQLHGIAACELKPVHPKKFRAALSRLIGGGHGAGAAADPALAPLRMRAPGGGRPMEVLVVEDNPICRKIVDLQLRNLGCTVECVASGREALVALRSRAHDVMLMELHAPKIDGLDAVRAIRAEQATGESGIPCGLRIVALTARALPADRAACLAAGMDDHVAKPVSADALHRVLARFATE